MQADNTQEQSTTQHIDVPVQSETSTKVDPLKDLKGQIASGPLPKLIEQLKKEWSRNKWLVVLALTTVILIIVLIFGLIGGAIIGAITVKPVDLPDLPAISPTERPSKSSIFDPLRQEVIDFVTILPDPAPPAVDQNINLDAKRN